MLLLLKVAKVHGVLLESMRHAGNMCFAAAEALAFILVTRVVVLLVLVLLVLLVMVLLVLLLLLVVDVVIVVVIVIVIVIDAVIDFECTGLVIVEEVFAVIPPDCGGGAVPSPSLLLLLLLLLALAFLVSRCVGVRVGGGRVEPGSTTVLVRVASRLSLLPFVVAASRAHCLLREREEDGGKEKREADRG